MDEELLDTLKRLAKAIAAQFGPNCEVVVHDLDDDILASAHIATEKDLAHAAFAQKARGTELAEKGLVGRERSHIH